MSEEQIDDSLDLTLERRRFWGILQEVEKRRMIGDTESVDEGETLLFSIASKLLQVHANGQAILPAEVARWLSFKLDEALHKEAARALRGTVGNTSGLIEAAATSFAAGYIARGPGGDIRGAKTRRLGEVMKAYRVSGRLPYTWTEQRPAFDNVLAKLRPDEDREKFLRRHLKYLGRQYQIARRKT